MGGGGQDVLWVILALSVWILLVVAAVIFVVQLLRGRRPVSPALPSALDILERRYAEGKIDRDQFDDARARLREH